MYSQTRRIWELDALRGFCILGMVVVHLLYDLMCFCNITALQESRLLGFLLQWGGIVFFFISGICATLGRHPIRRGLTVLIGGFVCSAATWGLYLLGLASKNLIIYFGVLHCLGCCMLLWPIFRKLPLWALLLTGAGISAVGLYFRYFPITGNPFTLPLGMPPTDFASSDYFPLLPNFGYFLAGSAMGRFFYQNKVSRFPNVNPKNPLVVFFTTCGRWALPIYLIHQPVIAAFLWLAAIF